MLLLTLIFIPYVYSQNSTDTSTQSSSPSSSSSPSPSWSPHATQSQSQMQTQLVSYSAIPSSPAVSSSLSPVAATADTPLNHLRVTDWLIIVLPLGSVIVLSLFCLVLMIQRNRKLQYIVTRYNKAPQPYRYPAHTRVRDIIPAAV
jgi:hypothetical protein